MEAVAEADPVRPGLELWQDYARGVLRRWFVQYNPMYLTSAALVLAGVLLISRHLGGSGQRAGELWLTVIIELYQLLLISGAALLYRVARQRRPAVLLALLEVVYICDVTFRIEVNAGLGAAGLIASALWLALFALKLRALCWAVKLRLSPAAAGLPIAAAFGIAILPQILQHELLDQAAVTRVIAWYVLGLTAFFAWLRPEVASTDELDEWGRIVLRRAVRATWLIWAVLLLGHVSCWAFAHELSLYAYLLVCAVLGVTLWARTELQLWAGAGGAILAADLLAPAALATAALMAALILCGKGFEDLAGAGAQPAAARGPRAHPYRGQPHPPAPLAASPAPPALRRPHVGALLCAYLSVWTFGWQGGVLPEPKLWLHLTVTLILLLMAWRWRLGSALIAALAVSLRLGVARQVLTLPEGPWQWGVLLLGSGFGLLVLGLALSWHLREREEPADAARSGPG